jgi:hypothetical protein
MEPALRKMLEREEYIEQAYLFKALQHSKSRSEPVQEMLKQLREEVLATTQLPMAIDFLLAELRHVGTMGTAMKRLGHYFTSFQTFIIDAAEDDHGRFDMQIAFLVLEAEARFRADSSSPVAMFLYQMETVTAWITITVCKRSRWIPFTMESGSGGY